MPDYNKVINNLNRKLLFKFTKIRVVPDEEGEKTKTIGELVSGPSSGFGFNFHYSGERYPGVNDKAKFNDPRDADAMDSDYTTHIPANIKPDHTPKGREEGADCEYEDESNDEDDNDSSIQIDLSSAKKGVTEAEGDIPDAPMPEEPAAEDPSAEPDMGDDMGGDPGMGDEGMPGGDMSDPGLGDPTAGMPGEEPPKDPNELGRTYEMKKIYARLVSMNEYLADERSPRIVKTKISIAKAIDLFSIIGANPESYKEKIDEIIVSYYKFLEAAYRRVKAFYRGEVKRVGGMPLTKNEEQKDDKSMEVTI